MQHNLSLPWIVRNLPSRERKRVSSPSLIDALGGLSLSTLSRSFQTAVVLKDAKQAYGTRSPLSDFVEIPTTGEDLEYTFALHF